MIGVFKSGPYYEKGPLYTRVVGKNDHFTVISMSVHGHFSIISLQNMMVKCFWEPQDDHIIAKSMLL